MEKMFRYSDEVYSVIKYGEKVFPGVGRHPAIPVEVGEHFSSGVLSMQITEIVEQRKSKGVFKEGETPYWAKVKAKKR